jgi:hypothetical protein
MGSCGSDGHAEETQAGEESRKARDGECKLRAFVTRS